MATIIFPLGALLTGQHAWGPLTVPADTSIIELRLDRSALLSVTIAVNWSMELSSDSGVTWVSIGGSGINFANANRADPTYLDVRIGAASGSNRGSTIMESADGQQFKAGDRGRPPEGWRYRDGADPSSRTRRVRGLLTMTEAAIIALSIDFR